MDSFLARISDFHENLGVSLILNAISDKDFWRFCTWILYFIIFRHGSKHIWSKFYNFLIFVLHLVGTCCNDFRFLLFITFLGDIFHNTLFFISLRIFRFFDILVTEHRFPHPYDEHPGETYKNQVSISTFFDNFRLVEIMTASLGNIKT